MATSRNYLHLNGHSLRVLLAVLDEGSVSTAALRLELTQSAVSHTLDKLRDILGDPLFVRAGRGIEPTKRALALREPIQALLDGMREVTTQERFDPRAGLLKFTVAANDFQRDLIFPRLLQRVRHDRIDTRFRFVASGIPAAATLRSDQCDLVVTPFPPEGTDIFQVKLFDDRLACFYDPQSREAPSTLSDFLQCDLVEARFDDQQSSLSALHACELPALKSPCVSVPNFLAIEPFVRGTKRVTVTMRLMKLCALRTLQDIELPFETRPISMYMVWHKRNHEDAAHQWLRGLIRKTCDEIIGSIGN